MTLPNYQDYYPFILKHADHEKTSDEYLELLVKDMGITEDDSVIKNTSGEPTVRNRLRWSIHYLRHAGLMNKPSRGKYVITERGIKIREERGLNITNKTLEEFEEYLQFKNKVNKGSDAEKGKEQFITNDALTPIESIENASIKMQQEIKIELMKQIFELSPYFFEKLVIDLLKKMGYGSFKGTRVTRGSNDGGIDGIVYQDALGLDIVYVQAKRYKEGNNIGRPEIQGFAGALDGLQASKGIFFTTSSFTPGAIEFSKTTTNKIVVIDGERLLNLLIEYEIGAEKSSTFYTYRINEDYFSE